MFGLLSDLDTAKWLDSPEKPPADKKVMADGTYAPWGLVKVSEDKGYLRYFLNSNSGSPSQGLLFGAQRNPLKDVGHCWMTFANKEPGLVITGIAIEDDWVIMKPEYLSTFGEPILEDKKEKELLRSETIDMGIYGDLVHGKWDKKGKPPRGKGTLDYHFYDVVRAEEVGKDFRVYLCNDKGHQNNAKVTEAARNPFHSITKGYFKIVDGIVKGIMVEDDWVEMYE